MMRPAAQAAKLKLFKRSTKEINVTFERRNRQYFEERPSQQ
jgi:ribosomal protein S21